LKKFSIAVSPSLHALTTQRTLHFNLFKAFNNVAFS
jgi:hypothetical protein